MEYRIFDKENNKYFSPVFDLPNGNLQHLMLNPDGYLIMREPFGIVHEGTFPDRFIVEMFTGLTDKNEVKIFEGDKIKISGGMILDIYPHEGVIVYNVSSFCMKTINEYDAVMHFSINYSNGTEIEVLGNIHDSILTNVNQNKREMEKKKPVPPIHPCQLMRGYSVNKLHENCDPNTCMLEGFTCINMKKLESHTRYDRASFLKKKLIDILED